MKNTSKLLLTLSLCVAATFTQAQTYVLPVEAFSSSSFIPGQQNGTIRNIGNKWAGAQNDTLTVDVNGNAEAWVSAAGDLGTNGEVWLSYDLGGQYNLTGVNLVNGATNIDRNIQNFDIQVSNNNTTWTNVQTGLTLAQATVNNAANQRFTFAQQSDYRYARIRATSNYGNTSFVNLTNALFEGTPAEGQSYVDMTTVTASTTMGEFSAGFGIGNTVGNTGINVPADPAGSTATDSGTDNWVSSSGNTGNTDGSQYIDFTLAENTDLQSIILYNGNDDVNAFRGINQFDVLVSDTLGGAFNPTSITDATLGLTSNSNVWLPGENWLLEEDNVRRIRLVVDSNHGDANLTMFQGLQIIAVPEPGTYALLGGLFALGIVALRRRR